MARQAYDRQSMDRTIVTSFYKSPVGCRYCSYYSCFDTFYYIFYVYYISYFYYISYSCSSSKGSGAVFYSDPRARTMFFSGTKMR